MAVLAVAALAVAWLPQWMGRTAPPTSRPAGSSPAALVRQLCSTDAQQRATAARSLRRRLVEWEQTHEIAAIEPMTELANCLAQQVANFDAESMAVARELVERMLAWQLTAGRSDRRQLLMSCDRVLHAALATTRSNERMQLGRTSKTAIHESETAGHATSSDPTNRAQPNWSVSGGLPIDVAEVPLPLPPPASELASTPKSPARLPASESSNPHPLPAANEPAAVASAPPAGVIPASALEGVTTGHDPQIVGWMKQLHDPDSRLAEAAAASLRRAGFNNTHVELARRLTDRSPAVRKELAESLVGVRGIDPEVWLTWLAEDTDAQVRLAALTVMATTANDKLLKQVVRIARGDEDPRVQELGQRLSESQRQP